MEAQRCRVQKLSGTVHLGRVDHQKDMDLVARRALAKGTSGENGRK